MFRIKVGESIMHNAESLGIEAHVWKGIDTALRMGARGDSVHTFLAVPVQRSTSRKSLGQYSVSLNRMTNRVRPLYMQLNTAGIGRVHKKGMLGECSAETFGRLVFLHEVGHALRDSIIGEAEGSAMLRLSRSVGGHDDAFTKLVDAMGARGVSTGQVIVQNLRLENTL